MQELDPKQIARERAQRAHPALVGLSHWIHANPELGYSETLAAGWIAEWLEKAGFEVQRTFAGVDTAVAGSFGPGPLHVALLAEYDALPGIGHACGHNVIAAAAVGAGVALAGVAQQLGLRVSVIGTPAEENGGGKIRLIDGGGFDGVHVALMIHPGPADVLEPAVLAAETLRITYRGQAAHASAFPERGINAADALVVAEVAIALLRQRLRSNDRVHGIVTRGGEASNVIPDHTSAELMIRAASQDRLAGLREQVMRCLEAGAVATGAELSVQAEPAYREMRHDMDLADAYRRNAEALGRTFEGDDRIEFDNFSSDIGNLSLLVPAIHPVIGIGGDAINHTAAFAEAAVSPGADRAILDGAVALAWTAIDAVTDEDLKARLLAGGLSGRRRRQATRRAGSGCAGGQCSARSRAGSHKAEDASRPGTRQDRPSPRGRRRQPAQQDQQQ
ncbi:MAG TPA: M20 family metallopeptidase [Candidatus Limnocylindrales bacterium]|jgi:amidohydrolase|nr:M20 family metallopeptidase [Candidatus Limnocylindrales bacterium]